MARMTQASFEALAERLRREEQASPRLYRAKVFGLVWFGYLGMFSVICGVALFILAVTLAAAATPLGWFLVVVLLQSNQGAIDRYFRLIRLTLTSLPSPKGLLLTRQHAPGLFAELERIREELRAPEVHHVLLDATFNAGVVMVPRMMLLGSRRFLCVGLPLLDALTPEQLRAVLAHELGHIARSDGRFGGWLYRVSASWNYLNQCLEGQPGSKVVGWFMRRYMPYFKAYTLVLSRAREYTADAFSVRICGAEVTASALIAVELRERQLREQLWSPLETRNQEQGEPPSAIYGEAREILAKPLGAEDGAWLEECLEEEGDAFDTHPALRQRLEALGVSPEPPAEVPVRASTTMLESECLANVSWHFSHAWLSAHAGRWIQSHQQFQKDIEELAQLEERAEQDELWTNERLRLAQLVLSVRGMEEAEPLFAKLAEDEPTSHEAWLGLGMILLRREDPSGVPMLEYAAQRCPETAVLASRALVNWFAYQSDEGGLERALSMYSQAQAALEYARRERREWLLTDPLRPAELSQSQRARLMSALDPFPGPLEVYVAAKQTYFYPERVVHVIALRGTGDSQLQRRAADAIRAVLPEWRAWILYWLPDSDGRLARIRDVPRSQLR